MILIVVVVFIIISVILVVNYNYMGEESEGVLLWIIFSIEILLVFVVFIKFDGVVVIWIFIFLLWL